ncbi:hypothetical protein C8A05DRAFT_32889 [Staphylotrichum tortipilum]|uniref:Nucleoside-diphosphate-sugar epimerase n=1 Tax=Staphylotrichum tortipilum TaxID=2831512 RepID=A0AAN6MN07_9PEZI|nr:hypothetical protein C8A05DRAFT_32889 [Staphylotrichum longicolle]
MHLILTGATGLVGTAVLDAMIRTKDVTKISVLSRRPVKFADDRINVIIHEDFASYDPDLLSKLRDAQGCVWALGISQTQVSKEEYVTITKTYPLAAAKAFQSLPQNSKTEEPFHFVYVSGEGATFTPGRLTPFFGKVKGEAELSLGEIQASNPASFRATSVRPAFVDWTGHEEIKPFLPDFGLIKNVAGSVMSPIVRFAAGSSWSPTKPLGKFLTGMAMGMWDGALDGEGVERLPSGLAVVRNTGIRRVMGLDAERAL